MNTLTAAYLAALPFGLALIYTSWKISRLYNHLGDTYLLVAKMLDAGVSPRAELLAIDHLEAQR